jgi:hypothetical protein
LIDVGRDAPAFLKFDLGQGDVRCIDVRPIDMKKFPSEIFANRCTSPTARWQLGGGDAEGFGDVTLVGPSIEPNTLCLGVERNRVRAVIAACSEQPEQRWKRVPITID